MGKVIKLKFPDLLWLSCDSCGKTSFELIFDDHQFNQDKGGICFLVCRSRGCGARIRCAINWGMFENE